MMVMLITRSPSQLRLALGKLKDPKMTKMFQAKISEKFSTLRDFGSVVDKVANTVKGVLLSTAFGDRGRRFNLGSQTSFWICSTRDGS